MSKIMELVDQENFGPSPLKGTDKRWLDADTLAGPGGERYRLQGFDAAEVEKVVPTSDGKSMQVKAGTAGGTATTDIVSKLAEKHGYNNVVPVLDKHGQPVIDPAGGRIVAELQDASGKSLNQELINAGAFDINKFNTAAQIFHRDTARHNRERLTLEGKYQPTEFDRAADMINAAEMAEGAKMLGFKQTALNEAEYAQHYHGLKAQGYTDDQARSMLDATLNSSTQLDHWEVDALNMSNNPLSDAWDRGWAGAKEGMYGMLNLLGEEMDNEWLADMGEDGVKNMQLRQEEMGDILTDYKDVDSFSTAMQFLGNNMAMSLPYMAITAGGAAVGTAATAATGGGALAVAGGIALGTAPSASVYAGQVWNEMEGEKSAAVAVGAGIVQASLDRLGLGGVVGKLAPDRAFQQGVQHIMKQKGVTKEVASEMLAGASKQEARLLTQEAIKIASKQQQAKQVGMDLLRRVGVSGASESVTEAGQEATAYLAATMGSDKEFHWEELNERMVAAMIAGGAIGGAISAPGSARQAVMEADLVAGGEIATDKTASQAQIYANQEREAKGYVPSIDENLMEIEQYAAQSFQTQEQRAEKYRAAHGKKSTFEKFSEAVKNPGALVKGATANIFTPELQEQSVAARKLADMFGANNQKIYSGANYENFKHHQVARYKNMIQRPENYFAALSGGKRVSHKMKKQLGKKAYEVMQSAIGKDGVFDPNLIPDSTPHKATYVQLAADLQKMGDAMHADQKKFNPSLGYEKNYLMKFKALSKEAVHANSKKFQELLQSEYNYSLKDAKDLVDQITTNPEANTLEDAFSLIKGGIVPSSHKSRSLGLSENAKFAEFMEQDLFANLSHASKSAARYTAHRKFIGQNGSVVSKFLDQMQQEGVPEAEVDKVAAQLQDYFDAESGNYKRPKTEQGKKLQRIQKNAMMFMTLSSLPLATISSFVELMLTNRGLTAEQVWGKNGSLQAMGKEGGAMVIKEMGTIANFATGKQIVDHNVGRTQAQQELEKLGFYDWDVGAATVTGVSEINAFQQRTYEVFFKAIGLQQWTDYTRAVRASMGADYMLDNANIYWTYKTGDGDYTRDVQQAEEKLRNLGLDVDKFSEIQTKVTGGMELTPEESAYFQEAVREASFNFVNEAIALPSAASRPLIYQDPRFALFTQFQGFIATFTAKHIPKLWGEYVKRGTPAMKYNAFATMATMIMMGFVSMALKDYLKYGDDEDDYEFKTAGNPYLDTAEYIQRGVYASGLLGVAERPLQWLNPIYATKSQNPGDWAFNNVIGESPALSWTNRVGKGALDIMDGDVSGGTEKLFKAAPMIGPFSNLNRKMSGAFEDWNFAGTQ